jgi:hypothetical protein
MRSVFCAAAACAAACAPLQSAPLPPVGPPEIGVVTAKRTTEVASGETAGERAAWALLSLNPIVIAGAVLAAEDDYGRTRVNEYDLALSGGGSVTVRSRYIVEPGQCVIMRRPTDAGYAVLVAQPQASCAAAPETVSDRVERPSEGPQDD